MSDALAKPVAAEHCTSGISFLEFHFSDDWSIERSCRAVLACVVGWRGSGLEDSGGYGVLRCHGGDVDDEKARDELEEADGIKEGHWTQRRPLSSPNK